MKQKDIALIIVIAAAGGIISFIVGNMIFASPKSHNQTAPVVQPITADFPQPDNQYFNANSIDPTKVITVGQNANQNPFNGTSNP
jgi:hypothetical protein